MAKHGLIAPDDSSAKAPTEEAPPKEKTTDELLLQLGDFVSLGHMDKELEVENKIMAKLDRLFKRFFQIKAMKSLMGERDVPAPALGGATPVLELTATDTSTCSGRAGSRARVCRIRHRLVNQRRCKRISTQGFATLTNRPPGTSVAGGLMPSCPPACLARFPNNAYSPSRFLLRLSHGVVRL